MRAARLRFKLAEARHRVVAVHAGGGTIASARERKQKRDAEPP
jgi:hypothetical protein